MIPLPSPQQLRYLLALAETQHFGRAARICGVTQSTLSAGILTLERQMDAAILDRAGGKRVMFTALGLAMLDRARAALAALEAVNELAASARSPMSGPLRLGVIPTIGPFLLPHLMPALRAAFPKLRLFLREDLTGQLVSRLTSNRLDLLLLALPCACAGAETLGVSRDEFLVAMPPGHRLAARDRVPAAALAAERLLLLEDGHCLRDQALSACAFLRNDHEGSDQAGGESGEDHERYAATSLHTLTQMVAGGFGVTLLPRLAAAAGIAADAGLVLRPLAGAGAWRTLGLAWRPNAPRAADYRAMAPVLAEACNAAMAAIPA